MNNLNDCHSLCGDADEPHARAVNPCYGRRDWDDQTNPMAEAQGVSPVEYLVDLNSRCDEQFGLIVDRLARTRMRICLGEGDSFLSVEFPVVLQFELLTGLTPFLKSNCQPRTDGG
jgi:hypothetical protein